VLFTNGYTCNGSLYCRLTQTSSDANGDYSGTHSINDICMKIHEKAIDLKGDVHEIDKLP
jgi:hypothetical protein